MQEMRLSTKRTPPQSLLVKLKRLHKREAGGQQTMMM
jgi:hypothetical protein